MITITHKGNFGKLNSFLEKMKSGFNLSILDKYGEKGVEALIASTPKDTGRLALSWYYVIERDKDNVKLIWCNDDIEGGENVALLIRYGHGTKSGGYISGVDYITPAIKPIFDEIESEIWKEVR